MTVTPYTIHVSDERIARLKQKLEASAWPGELEGASWDLGSPLKDVKRLAEYWRTGFNWRRQEAKLNDLPNYHTTISAEGFEPLDVHFVHQRSEVTSAIPLLFGHGGRCLL